MILRAAPIAVVDLERVKPHALYRRKNDMRKIDIRQPVLQVGRQQKRLVAVTGNKIHLTQPLYGFAPKSAGPRVSKHCSCGDIL